MRRAEVRERLRGLIEECEPGDALPSERDLSDDLGASRPTIRAAIEELAQEGLLVRRHGRGTFTNPRKISQEVPATAALPPQLALAAEARLQAPLLEIYGSTETGASLLRNFSVCGLERPSDRFYKYS